MNFSLKNVDDRIVSLDDFPDAQGFIIVFTCNHCPYAIAYENRLKELHATYADKGYPLIAINPNDPVQYPQDSFEQMKVRAASKGFEFPYLFDESQEIARQYGATRTPHAFILQKTEDGLEVKYKGAIDDNYQSAHNVKQRYLAKQLDALIAGKAVPYKETAAIGCTIKWKQPA
ncbi:MAG: thioredoxin family protein [Bacteroidetes bacterium]|nr:MAG: thioredoxin family protein [Bacteroidota bacterium]